jgi:hypothetical protein
MSSKACRWAGRLGEHRDGNRRPDAFLEPVEHRPQIQVVGFDLPEVR